MQICKKKTLVRDTLTTQKTADEKIKELETRLLEIEKKYSKLAVSK